MKKRQVVVSPFFRNSEVCQLFKSRALVERAERFWGLKPIHRRKRLTLYKRDDVLAILARLNAGEFPE